MKNRFPRARERKVLAPIITVSFALALPLTACEDALEVEEPTFATPETLNNPAGLVTLFAGAVGDFQVAYSGSGGDAYLSVVSLITDELHSSGSFTTRTATDQRDQFLPVEANTSDAAYNRLHRVRVSAGEVADVIAEVSEEGRADSRYPVARSLEGFAIVALAEAFCSNIPISTSRGGVPLDPGQPLSTQEMFDLAVTKFDDALASDANFNLAKVGRARAMLNNGEFAGAAAAVSGVPTSFIHFIEHSDNSGRQFNPIFSLQANGRYSMSDGEGGGLSFRSSGDPRLPWVEDPGGGFISSIRLFIDLRYPDFDSNVVLADGIEARLIEAEAALRAGNAGQWLTILNELRANVAALMAARYDDYNSFVPGPNNPDLTLAALSDPGTDAARVDLMFQERAFWLFNTGHRLGDLRRLIRQYGRSQADVFPTGDYHKGGVYGTDVNFPIPFNETQNPNYQLDMCDTKSA